MCLVAQSCPTLCDPIDNSPTFSSIHGDSLGKNSGMGCHALLPKDLSNREIKYRPPTWQADSLLSEPPGEPNNTGVCSLSLSPGDLPDPGIEPGSPVLQADSLPAAIWEAPTGRIKKR